MSNGRGKKLEWQGGVLTGSESKNSELQSLQVKIKSKEIEQPATKKLNAEGNPISKVAVENLQGNLKIRREVKGRGGKPVSVLFDIEFQSLLKGEYSFDFLLKEYSSFLKQKLACGGTVDEKSIVLQVDDIPKVRIFLEKKGWRVKGS